MTFVVVVADPVHRRGLDQLSADPQFEVVHTAGRPDEFLKAVRRAHAILVRSETQLTEEVVAQSPHLRVIGRAGIGVDNIDIDAATRRGIAVLNTPGGNTVSAAEHGIALLLSLVRNVPGAVESMRRGEWDRKRFSGTELRGKTMGLLGLGRIGAHVATIARAFGMEVVAHDPYLSEGRAAELRVKLVALDELLECADAVSLHLPLTPETRNIMDARRLGLMKPTAVLLNTARGGLVDEDALREAVATNRIAGAAIDVFETEPLPAGDPLREAERIILTPHLAASTAEAQERVSLEICDLVRNALVTGAIGSAVNVPGLSSEALQRLQPLLELSRRLGRLATDIAKGRVESIEVRYGGVDDMAPRPVMLAVVEGVLGAQGVGPVTLVNAAVLAKERGISVERRVGDPVAGFETTVTVEVVTAERTTITTGALIGDRFGRVIQIGDYAVDVPPEGCVLVLRNRDVPGVIGQVGTYLGESKINIGAYHQSRKGESGGEALAAIAVDHVPDAELVARLESIPEVLEVSVATLDPGGVGVSRAIPSVLV